MNNLQKRIFTSLLILPLSFFFVVKGGYFLTFFLIFVLFAGMYELFSVFKNKTTILFLGSVLILSLFSIYYLRNDRYVSSIFLYWVIILCICSDIGGYAFGKIFKGKKLTKISPKKTISGVFGSFFFSLVCLVIVHEIFYRNPVEVEKWLTFSFSKKDLILSIPPYFLSIKYFLLTIIFSMVAQAGDLTISHFKRLEEIKDTGKILPGHGGILDRVDGIIFAISFVFVYLNGFSEYVEIWQTVFFRL